MMYGILSIFQMISIQTNVNGYLRLKGIPKVTLNDKATLVLKVKELILMKLFASFQ